MFSDTKTHIKRHHGDDINATINPYEGTPPYYTQYNHYHTDMYNPDNGTICNGGEESCFWEESICSGGGGGSPRSTSSDTVSGRRIFSNSAFNSAHDSKPIGTHYQIFGQFPVLDSRQYCTDGSHNPYEITSGYSVIGGSGGLDSQDGHRVVNNPSAVPFVRVVKRRTTANKKERRRTQSINNAYADLRDCIPNVPADTKLSKIKTLQLATLYISYLKGVLETNAPDGGFRAELQNLGGSGRRHSISVASESRGNHPVNGDYNQQSSLEKNEENDQQTPRKSKSRTGWPQHVWALEFKQE